MNYNIKRTFFTILVLAITSSFVFLISSCQKKLDIVSADNVLDNIQGYETAIQKIPQKQNHLEGESIPKEEKSNNSEEPEVKIQNSNEEIAGQESDTYKEKIIRIERITTIYEDIYTGSLNIEIDLLDNTVTGYLFMGYMEVKMIYGRSSPCENVIKGSIAGTLDETTGKIDGEIKCNIESEGKDCFTGLTILKLSGNIIEEGRFIEGNLPLPSGNFLYFQLEKLLDS